MFGGKKAAIKLNFEDQSEGPLTRVHRSVGLEKLSAGQVLARSHDHRLQRQPAAVESAPSRCGSKKEWEKEKGERSKGMVHVRKRDRMWGFVTA